MKNKQSLLSGESDIEIIPSVLSTTEEDYKEKIEKITQSSELADGWLQLDVADGKFVNNTTVGQAIIKKYPLNIDVEAHLMVESPGEWLEDLRNLGVKRVIFHLETGHTPELIQQIKGFGFEVGIALNPETPVAKIGSFIGTIDLVLLMSVHPGFGGQEFIVETVEKVKEVSRLRSKDNKKFLIEVDGGINERNAKDLVQAGADNLVIGEQLINGDILENLTKIWEVLRPQF